MVPGIFNKKNRALARTRQKCVAESHAPEGA
jgi:hypothetical protein